MKRFWILLLAALMLLSLLVACKKDSNTDVATTTLDTVNRESLANVQIEREAYVIEIVMAHCSLSKDDINVLSLNHNEETKLTDFFFLHGEIEYMYTVNYETGEIISYTSNVSSAPSAEENPTEAAE